MILEVLGMPARRHTGRMDVCCQSNKLTTLHPKSGDRETRMSFGRKSGWRMQKPLSAESLGTRDEVMPGYRSSDGDWRPLALQQRKRLSQILEVCDFLVCCYRQSCFGASSAKLS